jgi:hypothetical protein
VADPVRPRMPEIRASFRHYVPSRGLSKSVEKLLSVIPAEQLGGLDAIVLTDADSIGKGQTQRVRGRQHARRDCLGFYHPAGRRNAAWIEIVVDNVLHGVPRLALSLPLVRELLLGRTVYHEVGHHLQHVYGARLGAATAEKWSRRLSQSFLRGHYAWLGAPGLASRARMPSSRVQDDEVVKCLNAGPGHGVERPPGL